MTTDKQTFDFFFWRTYVPFVCSSSSKYVKNDHCMLQQCPRMHRFGFLLHWSTVIYISKRLLSRKNLSISYWLHQLSHRLKISFQSALCTSPLNRMDELVMAARLQSEPWEKKMKEFWLMNRRSRNRPKKTKTVSKRRKKTDLIWLQIFQDAARCPL